MRENGTRWVEFYHETITSRNLLRTEVSRRVHYSDQPGSNQVSLWQRHVSVSDKDMFQSLTKTCFGLWQRHVSVSDKDMFQSLTKTCHVSLMDVRLCIVWMWYWPYKHTGPVNSLSSLDIATWPGKKREKTPKTPHRGAAPATILVS